MTHHRAIFLLDISPVGGSAQALRRFQTSKVAPQDDVGDATDCVGSVERRSAVSDHFDPINRAQGDRSNVDALVEPVISQSMSVQQRERGVGSETAKIESSGIVYVLLAALLTSAGNPRILTARVILGQKPCESGKISDTLLLERTPRCGDHRGCRSSAAYARACHDDVRRRFIRGGAFLRFPLDLAPRDDDGAVSMREGQAGTLQQSFERLLGGERAVQGRGLATGKEIGRCDKIESGIDCNPAECGRKLDCPNVEMILHGSLLRACRCRTTQQHCHGCQSPLCSHNLLPPANDRPDRKTVE